MPNRRNFLKQTMLAGAALGASYLPRCGTRPKPNILWIIAEDICPDMACYGNKIVKTPNIDRLASEGVRYTHCFTTNPVCSPSRSAFMTGMYQTTIGAHHHRSHRADEMPQQPDYRLPEPVRVITDYFRQAGYFTANVKATFAGMPVGGKTDWNFSYDHPFDSEDWNNRAPEQPFYAQINMSMTHRTFRNDPDNPIDPDAVELPPYYVDHPLARRDWADYLESIQVLDKQVGDILQRVKDEGLLDNTIIFFFGDNGRPHFRAKQWLYDPGIHVPLIIRFPSSSQAGQTRDELISAIDIAATSLWLAGIQPPAHLQGQVFLGRKAKKRDFIVAARDRCDETVDRIRCLRTRQYKYIRNYYPDRPYAQLNRYKETQYPVLRLMRRLAAAGELNEAQARFFAPSRPAEELYDLQTDPHEIYNLADDQNHADILSEMRQRLDEWIAQTGDRGEVAEDPAIATFYKQKMIDTYNEPLKRIYQDEGMDVNFLN